MDIIAHRGASYDAPENTLAAIGLAWEQGADAVEIDVFLSKDGKIVAIHDETTERFAGVNRHIADQTLAELKLLDVGRWKDERWAGEPIPELHEVIATVPKGKRLFIEIKCGPDVIPELKRVLDAWEHSRRQAILIGLSRETMRTVKRELPDHTVCWVAEQKKDQSTKWTPSADELVRDTLEAGLDGLDLSATEAIDRELVSRVKQAGLPLFVWTVNDAAQAARLEALGIDGITTDRPGWLRRQLNAR